MLTDPKLKSQVDSLWDKIWSGGLSNPLDAIEQLSYLIFLKRLDDRETAAEKRAKLRNQEYVSPVPRAMRWQEWTQYPATEAFRHVKEFVFPHLKEMGVAGTSFHEYMQNAEFKISKPSLLIEATKTIDQMAISQQNQDVQGDLYEYLLSKLNTAGRNGQFRTPRHIIRLMVRMMHPVPGERIADLAAGTCGFLVNAYQHLLATHTSATILQYDEAGEPHNLAGDLLKPAERDFLQKRAFRAFDNDAGMTMLRIGSMNLMLHGIEEPHFFLRDTLSKEYTEQRQYDLILMNPPFKGAIDKGDVHPQLPKTVSKTELLFLHRILLALDSGGRAAVIVPDGVLFGSSKAHTELRQLLVEQHRLDGVVSMPSGVFKPYAGVSTAILFFTKGAKSAEDIWFYDMAHDGFSLDDKRTPTAENDLADILESWQQRTTPTYRAEREGGIRRLRATLAPLKTERLALEKTIHELTFHAAIASEEDTAPRATLEAKQAELNDLNAQIAPIQSRYERLTRQFYVPKAAIKKNKYDLSASRYRPAEQDDRYHAPPRETLARLAELERIIGQTARELEGMLG